MRFPARAQVATLAILVCAVVCCAGETQLCEISSGVWQPGMYWRYDTVSNYHTITGGNENEGTVVFLALARTSWLGLESWALAVVWRWVDGSNGMSLFDYRGPTTSVRWPLIVDALPGALTTSSRSELPVTMATEPLTYFDGPIRVERVSGPVESGVTPCCPGPEWLDGDPAAAVALETVTLIPGDTRQEVLPLLGESYLVRPIEYIWTGLSTRNVGEALWSPDLEWWVSAVGHEEWDDGSLALSYEVRLSEWGTHSSEELLRVLQEAIDEMASADRPSTDCLIRQLHALGISVE